MVPTRSWKARCTEPRRPLCSFLIPLRLEPFFQQRLQQFGGLAAYLNYLLLHAARLHDLECIPNVERVTRKYQRPRQQLQRYKARIPGDTWTILRCFSGGHGLTMCHMFVILMRLDQAGELDTMEAAASAIPTRVSFLQKIDLADRKTRRKTRITTCRAPPFDRSAL